MAKPARGKPPDATHIMVNDIIPMLKNDVITYMNYITICGLPFFNVKQIQSVIGCLTLYF